MTSIRPHSCTSRSHAQFRTDIRLHPLVTAESATNRDQDKTSKYPLAGSNKWTEPFVPVQCTVLRMGTHCLCCTLFTRSIANVAPLCNVVTGGDTAPLRVYNSSDAYTLEFMNNYINCRSLPLPVNVYSYLHTLLATASACVQHAFQCLRLTPQHHRDTDSAFRPKQDQRPFNLVFIPSGSSLQ